MITLSSGQPAWGSGLVRGRLAVVLTLSIVVLMASVQTAGADGAVDARVLEDTHDRIVIQYTVGDYAIEPVLIDGREYSRISLDGASLMQIKGSPALPHVCNSIIIPNDAHMVVNVLESRYYDVDNADIAPSKGAIPRRLNPNDVPYTFGKTYEKDAFFPGESVALGEPYILRDYRGMVVKINPLQYNPVTRLLRVYTEVTVEVVRIGAGQINVLNRTLRERELSLAFHTIYEHHFLNYALESRYSPMDETGDMLIICHDAWLSNVQPLVDHKNAIGINTTVVGVSTIGNNSTSIKNYIQNAYDTGDLAFVLLVGDAAEVTTFTAVTGYNGASDPTYSLLAGGDDYPEIIVGRFSAGTSGEVDTQVERTIEYELMPATTQDWFWKGMGVASSQGTGDDGEYDWQHMRNIRADLLGHGYTTVDELYDGSQGGEDAAGNPTTQMVADCLNAGRGIVNYCGHGSPTSWSTSGFSSSYVNALTNDNMLPFIVSVACNNGEFDNYTTCFAEAWLRATNGSEPTGAIGCYASSISQPWDPPMEGQDEFNLLYVAETYHSYGALCYAASCSMMDDYPGSGSMWGTGPATFLTWHIFGDPSLRVCGTTEPPTCDDGILNQGEDLIDCGGPCPACDCLVDGDCLFCNGETCDAYGECQPGDYPCEPEEWCDEENDVCVSLPPCAAEDVNCDGTTDSLDLGVVKNPANWLLPVASAAEPRADVNGDGVVDAVDLGIVKNPTSWLSSTGDCQRPE